MSLTERQAATTPEDEALNAGTAPGAATATAVTPVQHLEIQNLAPKCVIITPSSGKMRKNVKNGA